MNFTKKSVALSFLIITPLFASTPFQEDNVPIDAQTQCPVFDTNSHAFKNQIMLQYYGGIVTVNGMKWMVGIDKSVTSHQETKNTILFIDKRPRDDGCRYRFSYIKNQTPQKYPLRTQEHLTTHYINLHGVFVLIPVKEDV